MVTSTYELTISKTGFDAVKVTLIDPKCIKHAFDKQLKIIPRPNRSGDAITYVIDLNIMVESITFSGILMDESTDSALDKKLRLRAMMIKGGAYTITWDSNDATVYNCGIQKCEIAESSGNIGDEQDTKFYDITITFVEGDFK